MRHRSPDHLTAAELGLFLGLASASIRSLALRHQIAPVGKDGRAMLYDARAFVDTVGGHDRTATRKRRKSVQH